jgi:Cu+-exporting ATPase
MKSSNGQRTIELSLSGVDCVACVRRVQESIARLPGVEDVRVAPSARKVIIRFDPKLIDLAAIRKAIERAGYSVADPPSTAPALVRRTKILVILFSAVLCGIVAGEWFGVWKRVNEFVPFPLGVGVVIVSGLPIFRNVLRAAFRRRVTSHTLMTIGALAALIVGEWVTAAIVVAFMRIGSYIERLTAQSARRAVGELLALAPQTARVERNGAALEVPVGEVKIGEIVIVRPGEKIPVDGEVIAGRATVDQAAITGEAMPVEVAAGAHVFAATIAQFGSLRVKALRIGADTTFGRVIKMVEEAESHRADMQQLADRFSAYYLPIVSAVAALTIIIGKPLSAVAVLVVACSCSFALATPVAMLASIGASAKRGLLVKGGRYLEALARADVILLDKTGTLTLGRPQISDIFSLNGLPISEILALAASAERYSEHPLAEAVRAAARAQNLPRYEAQDFEALPGMGVRAKVNGKTVVVGNKRLIPQAGTLPVARGLEAEGKTLLFVACDDQLAAVLAASDALRPDVTAALDELRALGLERIELLTGDNERAAAGLAGKLGIRYRAELLPEDKIRIVKEHQADGHTVVMIGDGVNDAPALAQSDVGIAIGAMDVAIEAAHVALLREDWSLVPEAIRIARRTMRVVKMNLAFTVVYNAAGLALAAFGLLPPTLAAAAQSLPDLGILANSARLLRR